MAEPGIHRNIAQHLTGGELAAVHEALRTFNPPASQEYAEERRVRVQTEQRAKAFRQTFQLVGFAEEVRRAATGGPEGEWSGLPTAPEAAALVIRLAPEIHQGADPRAEFNAAVDIAMMLRGSARRDAVNALLDAAGTHHTQPGTADETRRWLDGGSWDRLKSAVDAIPREYQENEAGARAAMTAKLILALPQLRAAGVTRGEAAVRQGDRFLLPATWREVLDLSEPGLRTRVRAGLAHMMDEMARTMPHEVVPRGDDSAWQAVFQAAVEYAAHRIRGNVEWRAAALQNLPRPEQARALRDIATRSLANRGREMVGEVMFVRRLMPLLASAGSAPLNERLQHLRTVPEALRRSPPRWLDRPRFVDTLQTVLRIAATLPETDRIELYDQLCLKLSRHSQPEIGEAAVDALRSAVPDLAAKAGPTPLRSALERSLETGDALLRMQRGGGRRALIEDALNQGSDAERLRRLAVILGTVGHTGRADVDRHICDDVAELVRESGPSLELLEGTIGLVLQHLPRFTNARHQPHGWQAAVELAKSEQHANALLPAMAGRVVELRQDKRFDALRTLLIEGLELDDGKPLLADHMLWAVAAQRHSLPDAQKNLLTEELLRLADDRPNDASRKGLLEALDSTPAAEETVRRMRLDDAGRDALRQQLLTQALEQADDATRLQRLGDILRSVGRVDPGGWDLETCDRVRDAVRDTRPGPSPQLLRGTVALFLQRLDRLDDRGHQLAVWQRAVDLAASAEGSVGTRLKGYLEDQAKRRPAIADQALAVQQR